MLTSHRKIQILNFLSAAVYIYILQTWPCTGTAVATIISGTVALCLKDNRGNSIKWPWMVHSCRSTLFLTGLTDQSAAQSQRHERRRPTGGFLCAPRRSRVPLLLSGHDETETPKSITSPVYIRMPRRRVRIDLLFSPPRRRALVCPGYISNRSRMVFHPRRARLVLVFRPYPQRRLWVRRQRQSE